MVEDTRTCVNLVEGTIVVLQTNRMWALPGLPEGTGTDGSLRKVRERSRRTLEAGTEQRGRKPGTDKEEEEPGTRQGGVHVEGEFIHVTVVTTVASTIIRIISAYLENLTFDCCCH